MKVYTGIHMPYDPIPLIVRVHQDGKEDYTLKHIKRHSPTGMEIGYEGSGPADTALSILTDHMGLPEADRIYQFFKRDHVAKWKAKTGICFQITSVEIDDWIRDNIIGLENGNPRRREHARSEKSSG
jgi:hypothetical protein